MDNRKKQPFIISRLNVSRNAAPTSEKALSSSTDELNTPALPKQNNFLSRQSSFTFHDSAFKSHYNIFRTDPSVMTDLLEKYSQDNLKYRDEDFTQQAEIFITKIAAERRIPKELRARFPLYQILLCICKIFMLNEYEIVVFACSLDHCNWKIEDVVMLEDADFLKEFPFNFGVEISDDCKMFIMYLLIITFSLKQYLNEKNNVDKIQAYCEKICHNFQTLFNRWTKLSSFQKFNYSAPEINRKFKYLSKKDQDENITSVKDYNMIVDNIMTLTGSYSSKPKVDLKPTTGTPIQATSTLASLPTLSTTITTTVQQPQLPQPSQQEIQVKEEKIIKQEKIEEPVEKPPQQVFQPIKLGLLAGLSAHSQAPLIEPKPIFHSSSLSKMSTCEDSSRSNLDFANETLGLKIPSVVGGLSRQASIPSILPNFPLMKRQPTFELYDEVNRKVLKKETGVFPEGTFSRHAASGEPSSASLSLNQSFIKRDDNKDVNQQFVTSLSSLFKHGVFDESMIPGLSKRSSIVSQQPLEEIHLVPNLNSN